MEEIFVLSKSDGELVIWDQLRELTILQGEWTSEVDEIPGIYQENREIIERLVDQLASFFPDTLSHAIQKAETMKKISDKVGLITWAKLWSKWYRGLGLKDVDIIEMRKKTGCFPLTESPDYPQPSPELKTSIRSRYYSSAEKIVHQLHEYTNDEDTSNELLRLIAINAHYCSLQTQITCIRQDIQAGIPTVPN